MGWKTNEGNGLFLVLLPTSYQVCWAPELAQFNLCTGYMLDQLGFENGHFCSLIALTLSKKLGEILIWDDLTIALLPQNIKLAYLKYKKLFTKQGSYVSLFFIKHQHLKTWLHLLQFCPALYLWQNKLPWLIQLAQPYCWLLISFLYN